MNKPKQAFTMMELLVVIVVMTTVMGIGIGTWMSMPEKTAKSSLVSLLSGMIKQAQHQSITTSQPVILNISKNKISGIKRMLVWQENFEWAELYDGADSIEEKIDDLSNSTDYIEENRIDPVLGYAGYGWNNKGKNHFLKPFKSQRRLLSSDKDGFFVQCKIKTPSISSSPRVVPLLLLTEGEDDKTETAFAGIELWHQPLFSIREPYEDDFPDSKTVFSPNIVETNGDLDIIYAYQWILVAWIGKNNRASYPIIDVNKKATWENLFTTSSSLIDYAILSSDTKGAGNTLHLSSNWETIGFLCDGKKLSLYRGKDVVRKQDGTSLSIPLDTIGVSMQDLPHKNINIFVNRFNPLDNLPDESITSQCEIDQAQIYKLGAYESINLPSNLQSKEDYKIIITNGVVESPVLEFINESNVEGSSPMEFTVEANGDLK